MLHRSLGVIRGTKIETPSGILIVFFVLFVISALLISKSQHSKWMVVF